MSQVVISVELARRTLLESRALLVGAMGYGDRMNATLRALIRNEVESWGPEELVAAKRKLREMENREMGCCGFDEDGE
ncbi:MAG: hypothetical protein GC160_02925 [Acidobacteria bacterium]|nr:hypothetical protein [Acidobacteriota bacterium]